MCFTEAETLSTIRNRIKDVEYAFQGGHELESAIVYISLAIDGLEEYKNRLLKRKEKRNV